ncbi:MAG TPA: vanadium-dependent haloperoxidase [Puia sp.]|nr:vanadium-dependent haloperoxidase [Puia sp.]
MRTIFLTTCIIVMLAGCQSKKDYKEIFKNPALYCSVVHDLNTVVMGNNFSPMVASRNYLYAAVAGYEVIAGAHPDEYRSLAGQVHGLHEVPKPDPNKEINAELAALLAYCKLGESVTFPEGSMKQTTDSLKKMAVEHGMPDDVLKNTIAYADTVSSVIAAWSRLDNYAQTRGAPEYTVTDSPGRWVPTPPAYSSAAEPHWREIRTLVIDSPQQFMPPPPYKFTVTDKKSPYYLEVKKIQDQTDTLSKEKAWIAEFWDDNPFKLNVSGHLMFGTKKFSPGGHWMGIVGIAALKSGADFNKTVYAYAETAIALFDGFIQCWNIKYTYNTVRPETVINKYFDPNWRPHLQTPPFPEYTCGHCTISAAASQTLTHIFGDNFKYTDSTELEFGIPSRSYKSFFDAATETWYSRFYGGIHFYYCCELSNTMGNGVGKLVVDRLKMKLHD